MSTDGFISQVGWQFPVTLALAALTLLVISDYRGFRPGRYLAKPLAALGFVWLAISLGAVGSPYGQWLLAGLCACLVGDICLMFERERAFLAGLSAFLLGHLLYAVAFVHLPANPLALAASGPIALGLLFASMRWLAPYLDKPRLDKPRLDKPRLDKPHPDKPMKIPVTIYMLAITTMLLCACLTLGQPAGWLIAGGAFGFALSDLAVARQQFVRAEPANGLWGTPLYFGSQLLLAGSVAFI